MANYYNQQQQPPYNNFVPPFPPPQQQHSPPSMGYNAYAQPPAVWGGGYEQMQPHYSPTNQNMYNLDPTTPVLDTNQMNEFFREVQQGHIPTIPSAQPQTSQFPPSQSSLQYGYGYQGFALQQPPAHQAPPSQEAFPPQQIQNVNAYAQNQDVQMDDGGNEYDDWGDEDGEDDYAPPEVTAPAMMPGATQASPAYAPPPVSSVAQGKKPMHESPRAQTLPFNPFKSQSLQDAPVPPPAPQAHAAPRVPTPRRPSPPRLNLELRKKAGDALKDLHDHGFGYSVLMTEIDAADMELLEQLYEIYNVPREPPPKPVQETKKANEGENMIVLKALLQSQGFDIDDATLAAMITQQAKNNAAQQKQANTILPGLGAQPQAQHQVKDTSRPTPPNRLLSTSTPTVTAAANGNRNAYLAKLASMKGASASQQSALATTGAAPTSTLPGLGASTMTTPAPAPAPAPAVATPTPRKQINQEILKRKMEALRAAKQQQASGQAIRPPMPNRTDSMSSIQYESARQSDQSGDMTPENGDVVGSEEGEIEEDGEVLEKPYEPAPLPPKPPAQVQTTTLPSRPPTEQVRVASPRSANLPPRPPKLSQRDLPPATFDLSRYQHNNNNNNNHVGTNVDSHKRNASAAFGASWNAGQPAKRTQPGEQEPQPLAEPFLIDISSEEENELDDSGHDVMLEEKHEPPQPAPSTPNPKIQWESLKAKKAQLQKQIAENEARKKNDAAATSSPAVAAVGSPAALPTALVRPASIARASSIASRAALSPAATKRKAALDADIKRKQADMARLQEQMRRIQEDLERDTAEEAALAEEIAEFGVNPEGMTQEQMQGLRDDLVEGIVDTAKLVDGEVVVNEGNGDTSEEEGEIDEDEDEEMQDAVLRKGVVDALRGSYRQSSTTSQSDFAKTNPFAPRAQQTRRPETSQSQPDDDIGEADDDRAIESGSRILIHQVQLSVTKRRLQQLLKDYDITGISMPAHDNPSPKHRRNGFGHAFVDFLYPAEAEQAVLDLKDVTLDGMKISVDLVKPPNKPGGKAEREIQAKQAALQLSSQAVGTSAPGPKKGKQTQQTKKKGQEEWNANYCTLRFSGVKKSLCNRKSFSGWLARFKNVAKNLIFMDGERSGQVYIDLPDEFTAMKAVEVLSEKRSKQMPSLEVKIVDSPQVRQEAEAVRADHGKAKLPTVLRRDIQLNDEEVVGDEEESSGSESDDEAESSSSSEADEDDENTMSESDDGSEEGEHARHDRDVTDQAVPPFPGAAQATALQPAVEEDHDSDSMSESSSDSSSSDSEDAQAEEGEVDEEPDPMGNVGVSLEDVEDVPMDDDGISSSSSSSEESENSDNIQPSDDEEGEIEEPAQAILPAGDDSTSDLEEDEETDFDIDRMTQAATQEQVDNDAEVDEFEPAPMIMPVIDMEDRAVQPLAGADGSNEEIVKFAPAPVGADVPVVPAHEGEAPKIHDLFDEDAEGEDDDLWDDGIPGTGVEGVVQAMAGLPSAEAKVDVPIASRQTIAPEQPAMEQPNTSSLPVVDDMAATQQLAMTFDAVKENEDAEGMDDEDDDDFYEPTEAIPTPIEHQATEEADAEGEEDDYDPEMEAEFEKAFAESSDAGVPTVQQEVNGQDTSCITLEHEVDKEKDTGGIPGVSKTHEDAPISPSEEGEISEDSADAVQALKLAPVSNNAQRRRDSADTSPIHYDVPSAVPLGIESQSAPRKDSKVPLPAPSTSTSSATTFKPYVSALRSFKAYRVSPSFEGNVKPTTYLPKVDANQPLCPAEMSGKDCADRQRCPGQHWNDFEEDETSIICSTATMDSSRSKEEKPKYGAGMGIMVQTLRDENIHDLDSITAKLVKNR